MGYRQLDLEGKVAVVVGGSSGIGRTLALGLAQAGADVVSSARRIELVNSLADEIEALGKRSLRVTCDVADRDSLEKLLKACIDAFRKSRYPGQRGGHHQARSYLGLSGIRLEPNSRDESDRHAADVPGFWPAHDRAAIRAHYQHRVNGIVFGTLRSCGLQCEQVGGRIADEIVGRGVGQTWNMRECNRARIFSNSAQ